LQNITRTVELYWYSVSIGVLYGTHIYIVVLLKNMAKDYLHEELCYRDTHRDGKPYYQHEIGDSCDPDLFHLFAWDSFPGNGDSILELGCGDGFVTVILASMGLSVTGVDCSSAAIHRAAKNLKDAGFTATLHVGDVCRIDFVQSQSQKYVLDSHCLHCITDYKERSYFLEECHRVMSSEGKLFLATMAEQCMDWTNTTELSPWQKEREIVYDTDENGCYVQSLVPPGASERVNSRIFIREEVLRKEIKEAGFETIRFERFSPTSDPEDRSFLVELRKS